MSVREVRANMVQFMVNPMPVKNSSGKPKLHRGRIVYISCVHIDRQGYMQPHPAAYEFVVV